jgi:hypothetical protein
LPKETGASLLDKALASSETKASKTSTAVATGERPHTKHAHVAKHSVITAKSEKAPVVMSRHANAKGDLFYKYERLPDPIYAKYYTKGNKHLPRARYEQDYDALAFTTIRRDDMNGLRAILNTGRSANMVDANGDSLLITAVRYNAINAARLLLLRHADPNVQDHNGMTALAIARQAQNYPMQRALEEVGAAPVQVSSVQ